jgi:hypothetical protein
MPPENNQLETLKYILENSLHPEVLDSHPWTKSLIVLASMTDTPELEGKSPGQQLVIMVGKLFTQMMPSTPPKHGKRLDTNWGEYGILAVQYFAPLLFGLPSPVSLRDAWGRIDQGILLFVFGKTEDTISDSEKEAYKLVGNELEVAPNSTISDWHRKGLMRLADVILAREAYLSKSLSKPAVISKDDSASVQADDPSPGPVTDDKEQNKKIQKPGRRRFSIALLSILILLGLILIGGFKAWKIYDLAKVVYQDTLHIQQVITEPTPRLERAKAVGPLLATLRGDFTKLKDETEPFFWMGPWLEWVPVYGGELASIQDLATVADSLLATTDLSYQAVSPLIDEDGLSSLSPSRFTWLLKQAQPQLIDAQQELEQASTARSHLALDRLSPKVRDLIINKVDPFINLMQDGLMIAVEFPRLMGATNEGPKTYLLLVQNEDELRPTGGFITAAGTLLVKDGSLSNLNFRSSEYFDNWDRPYPVAPWQLRQYMNSRVLIFRDANWFTNYPTAALYAEYLYSYTNAHSVDGVIAFDQQMLVDVLGVTGPVEVEGVSYLIDASNVVSYMRSAKTPTSEDLSSPGWNNKLFINKLTRALIVKMFSGDVQWEQLFIVLLRVLDEHHLLLQLDSPTMTSFLERYHWDGAVRPGADDFLMVVDTNIGFNKTNADVESNLSYDVDLTKPFSPTASLKVIHKNNAAQINFCKHWNKVRAEGEKDYPITDCYWNYLRVYMKEGAKLLDATPQSVPDNWMILKQKNPGQVDILEEEIDGVQAFGALQVLLGGQSMTMDFEFALPADILKAESGSDQTIYHLKVQKQPGTSAAPITIRVQLPKKTLIKTIPAGAVIQGSNILYQTNLRTDIEFEVVFSLP